MDEKLIPALTPETETPEEGEKPDKVGEAPAERQVDEKQPAAADKETEEAEVEDEEKSALILGKFKSQSDLEKAYRELEKKSGKDSTEKARLRKELDEFRQRHPSTADLEPEKDELEELRKLDPQKWVDLLYQGPAPVVDILEKVVDRRTKAIREQVQVQHYETQVERFRRANPDLDDYSDEMAAFFEAHPALARESDALEVAYKAVKLDRLLSQTIPRIEADETNARAKAAAAKSAARMPGGATVKQPPGKEPTPEEAARAALLAEDKKARGIFG